MQVKAHEYKLMIKLKPMNKKKQKNCKGCAHLRSTPVTHGRNPLMRNEKCTAL